MSVERHTRRYGDLFGRDPQQVARDVRNSFVSFEGAKDDYCVVVADDFAATAALRWTKEEP